MAPPESPPAAATTSVDAADVRVIEWPLAQESGIDKMFVLDGDFVSGTGHRFSAKLPDELTAGNPSGRKLQVLHFNDLHNHLTDLSKHSKNTARFAQMAARAKRARNEADEDTAVLFLSVGDDHTGSAFDELMGWQGADFVADAGYRAYSAASLDVSVLGNHEFDRGSALLARGIAEDARFPILSANVHGSSHLMRGRDYFPAAIAVHNDLRVGMIGFTTSVEIRVGQLGDPTLAVASPLAALYNVLPFVEPLSDVILILSHCGYGDGEHKSGKSAAARDIGEADFSIARMVAAMTDKPAAVIGGHTHTALNRDGIEPRNTLDGVPILQAGCNGRFLGELRIELSSTRKRAAARISARLHEIEDGVEGGAFDAAHIAPLVQRLSGILETPIAQVETDRFSFSRSAVERYAGGCALIEFMCDAICERARAADLACDLALLNGASILSGLEHGTLTLGEWFDVMPYPDELMIVSMGADDLAAILRSNCQRVLRPEEIADTDTQGFLARGFLHNSHHLRYRISLGKSAAAAEPEAIRLAGHRLGAHAGRPLRVAVPAYLALGAFGERWNGRPITGGVPGGLPGYDFRRLKYSATNLIYRTEIAEHIKSLATLDDGLAHLCDDRLTFTDLQSDVA